MGSYKVCLKPSVEKDLRRLPKAALPRVMRHIEGLSAEPFPRRVAKVQGAKRLYRIPVGDYRIVYEVDTRARRITIHYLRHRREVYRRL